MFVIPSSTNLYKWSRMGYSKVRGKDLNTHYQWWSKAGGGPGYSHEIEKELYIQNFYWLSNWIDRYFFNKMSDFFWPFIYINLICCYV